MASTATRLRGRIDAQHCSDRGGWLYTTKDRCPFFFKWSDNRAIRPGIMHDTLVEFTLTTDSSGRPVAVDVVPVRATATA